MTLAVVGMLNTKTHSLHVKLAYFYSTVNSEIFARVYFHECSHLRSFPKTNPRKLAKSLVSFTDVGKLCLNVANMSLNAIHENKILAKISEFTVF